MDAGNPESNKELPVSSTEESMDAGKPESKREVIRSRESVDTGKPGPKREVIRSRESVDTGKPGPKREVIRSRESVDTGKPGYKREVIRSRDSVDTAKPGYKREVIRSRDSVDTAKPGYKREVIRSRDSVDTGKPGYKREVIRSRDSVDTAKPGYKREVIRSRDSMDTGKPGYKREMPPIRENMDTAKPGSKREVIRSRDSMDTGKLGSKKELLRTPTLGSIQSEELQPEPKKRELTICLALLTLVSCLGSSQFGFNMWLINDPATFRIYFSNTSMQMMTKSCCGAQMHPALVVFYVSAFLLGCMFGSLLIGPLADHFGRKGVLLINDLLSVASTILLAISKAVRPRVYFGLARFTIGICVGIFSCAVPLYLGEISPTSLRGRLVILPQFFVSIGILLSQVFSRPEVLGNQKGWPFMMSSTAIMALFQLFLLLPFPESPRYLLIQKRDEEAARQALQNLRNQSDVEDEIKDIRQEDLYEKKEKEITTFKLLHFPRLRWQLVCVMTLIASQQFSGFNAAYYYIEVIFEAMDINKKLFPFISALLTILLLCTHGLSIYLVDSWGRRPLLLSGFATCIIACLLLSTTFKNVLTEMAYMSAIFLFALLIGHIIGPGSIPHLMITELFLQSSRSSAYAIGGFLQWLFAFFIGYTYVLIENQITSHSFFIFLPFSAIGFLYVFKFVPETKKKTFLGIRKLLETFLAQKHLEEQPSATKKPERHLGGIPST